MLKKVPLEPVRRMRVFVGNPTLTDGDPPIGSKKFLRERLIRRRNNPVHTFNNQFVTVGLEVP